MRSRPVPLVAGTELVHAYRVFAGPKTSEALAPFGADDLAAYRKGWQLPGTAWIARNVITPLLGRIYGATASVAGMFGGKAGNWGIAIILLTITVRLALFPLSRKQAVAAKKMQDLQPKLMALKEKYKDDKERMGRETMEIYREAGVNPFGGCLLAIVQMPIFFGLWQALNNSVDLRGASFLWIDNLAAPDMLWKFPMDVPFLGPYLNVLPFLVVALMLVHMKLFSPPPATAEQAQSQKIMKYMMVVMAFMFYKVPSGLGIYFITSSTWAIAERVLLPKHLKSRMPATPSADGGTPPRSGPGGKPAPLPPGKPAPAGNGKSKDKGGWRDRLREKLEEVMEEANKDRTHRNEGPGRPDKDRDRKTRPRPNRPGPGRRR
jgi:YidC/Oxa1 family membrane protein insertase